MTGSRTIIYAVAIWWQRNPRRLVVRTTVLVLLLSVVAVGAALLPGARPAAANPLTGIAEMDTKVHCDSPGLLDPPPCRIRRSSSALES
ncbi:MAG: hypothetical protein IIC89_03135 [Chloroflexi bacterium]|nr:hypothetical protein [Chloroflexota bacterium]